LTQLIRLLGTIGRKVPELSQKEWDSIFEFIDYFITIHEEKPIKLVTIDWCKIKEILALLNKVKY